VRGSLRVVVLVVGGSGFLGRHLLERLTTEGVAVKAYGRRKVRFPGDVEHVYGDLLDRQRLREALQGVNCVFHFAWTTVPQTSNEDPQSDVQANVVAGLGLLEACRDAGVERVVFPSSGGTVYGGGHGIKAIEESASTDPITSYGISKLTVEKYLALYRHLYGLDFRVLRISNAYGEGQPADRPQGLIGVVLQRALSGDPITIWGDGSMIRDYVYAADAIDCCVRAAMTPLPDDAPRVFNVGSERGHSVHEVLSTVAEVTGRPLKVDYAPARACDLEYAVLSSRRARDLLHWSPQVSLREGISRTWAATNEAGRSGYLLD
jgi:UDP-glucose 4-epimerase